MTIEKSTLLVKKPQMVDKVLKNIKGWIVESCMATQIQAHAECWILILCGKCSKQCIFWNTRLFQDQQDN